MKNSLLAVLATSTLAIGASVASANTIVFDPLAPGEDRITQPGSNNNANIDLNQDGVDDVTLGLFTDGFGTAAFVRATQTQAGAIVLEDRPIDVPIGRPVDGPFEVFPDFEFEDDFEGEFNGGTILAETQRVLLSDRTYEAGDSIGAGDFTTNTNDFLFGRNTSSANNLLPFVGDSAFFGFQIEIGTGAFSSIDGLLFDNFVGDTQIFFGFLQISHGSIVIGTAGYSTVPNQAAVIPGGTTAPNPVPLPAGAVLLLGGLAGLGAMRQRRRA